MSSERVGTTTRTDEVDHHVHDPSLGARIAVAWAFVGVPLVYGVYETVKKAAALFS